MATGTVWSLPNYLGELFTADATATPLLSMAGGLSGGVQTTNFAFPTGVTYNYPQAKQPDISEDASLTAPTAEAIARKQLTNVTQIFQYAIDISYAKMASSGRLTGVATAGEQPNPANEKDWQVAQALVRMARDVEYTFINGVYQESTSSATSNKTRGMLELCKTTDGTTIDASGALLTKAMLDSLFLGMANNGASFTNPVIFCGAKVKQALTDIYAKQFAIATAETKDVGGYNIQTIEMDFAKVGIVWDRFMPDNALLVADMAYVRPVFQAVPDKGVVFVEDLAKTGASDRSQLFAQVGLDHAPAYLHGSITKLG